MLGFNGILFPFLGFRLIGLDGALKNRFDSLWRLFAELEERIHHESVTR